MKTSLNGTQRSTNTSTDVSPRGKYILRSPKLALASTPPTLPVEEAPPGEPLRNDKMEIFARHFATNLYTATDCARMAGYAKKGAKSQGSRLKNHPDVIRRVSEIRADAAERQKVTTAEVIEALRGAYTQAMLQGQTSAAVRAMELLGKMIGMFDKTTNLNIFQKSMTNTEEDNMHLAKIANITKEE